MKAKLLGLVALIAAAATGIFLALPAQAATSQLYTEQSCLPDGSVRVEFTWQGNNVNANQQWLDLSLFNNGWESGTFLGSGPMTPDRTALTWDGLISNTTHYVRVNQLLRDGTWDPSGTFYFATIACSSGPGTTPPAPTPDASRIRVAAPIESIHVEPASLPGRYVLKGVAGLPSGCAQPDAFDVSNAGNDITIKVYNTLPSDNRPCTLIYGYYDFAIGLGDLATGETYHIHVNDKVIDFTP